MATDIKVITVREFLETTGEGAYNFERGKALLESIGSTDGVEGGFHVLLDVRDAPYRLTLADISSLAMEFTRLQIGAGHKAAVVIESDRFDDALFFAVSARSMGNRIQAFASFEEAYEWLEQSAS